MIYKVPPPKKEKLKGSPEMVEVGGPSTIWIDISPAMAKNLPVGKEGMVTIRGTIVGVEIRETQEKDEVRSRAEVRIKPKSVEIPDSVFEELATED